MGWKEVGDGVKRGWRWGEGGAEGGWAGKVHFTKLVNMYLTLLCLLSLYPSFSSLLFPVYEGG